MGGAGPGGAGSGGTAAAGGSGGASDASGAPDVVGDSGAGSGGAAGPDDAATSSDGGVPVSTDDRSPGCAEGKILLDGEVTITTAGLQRKFRVHPPKGYSKDRAWPLVLALHPNGGAGIGFFDTDSRPVRSLLAERAILVLPLARPLGGGWDWRGDLPSDLAYFEALLTLVKTEMCVDTKRIFSLGFSGGASFSGVLGCRRNDIRAIATAGAVSYFDAKDCVGNPAAWIAIGKGELEAGRTAFRDFWRNRATCQPASMPVPPSPCVAYACPADRPVHYCEHPAGHIWPDFASQAAVDFFLKF
jgi:poly(3-hydroxybutyrate) depolymerase